MTFTIRKLSSDETPPMDLLLLADPNEEIVLSYLDRSTVYLMESEDLELIGVYLLLPTRPHTVEIVNIAVSEKFQGKGFGKKLLSHASETAKSEGFFTLEIGTGNSSIAQLGLYQKCGFSISGIDFGFFLRNYPEPIWENGIQCKDMIRLKQDFP
ncbi:GNAT family N-acetyltransferase [Leptospira dzoumogneensis]|uniref:GNAT family N-acetyltransferase n=1 Tax=Leptospira dzoumogneensis TaxID=2484904 RepID=A0A4Z1AKD0_9LEPT|nr:GNAT family N-acetyltransferase [Leptospira dzoumogneensis]TGM96053.1 GNAT family N-acetyltransferase [Leptospira dzoumogneensis]